MQTDVDKILDQIRTFRREREWSINKLATEADLPWSVLQGMDRPDWSPSLKTLRTLLALAAGTAPRRSGAGRKRSISEEGRAA